MSLSTKESPRFSRASLHGGFILPRAVIFWTLGRGRISITRFQLSLFTTLMGLRMFRNWRLLRNMAHRTNLVKFGPDGSSWASLKQFPLNLFRSLIYYNVPFVPPCSRDALIDIYRQHWWCCLRYFEKVHLLKPDGRTWPWKIETCRFLWKWRHRTPPMLSERQRPPKGKLVMWRPEERIRWI